jgi:hypothetical protein
MRQGTCKQLHYHQPSHTGRCFQLHAYCRACAIHKPKLTDALEAKVRVDLATVVRARVRSEETAARRIREFIVHKVSPDDVFQSACPRVR